MNVGQLIVELMNMDQDLPVQFVDAKAAHGVTCYPHSVDRVTQVKLWTHDDGQVVMLVGNVFYLGDGGEVIQEAGGSNGTESKSNTQ